MNVRMKESEYIEKAKALVEAKKQYYATLSELSQLTPDEEKDYAEGQPLYNFLKLLIEYRDKNEKVPLSLLGKTLGDSKPTKNEKYYTPKEAYETFLCTAIDVSNTTLDEALVFFENVQSMMLVQPIGRVMRCIFEFHTNKRYDIKVDEIRAYLSFVNKEDATIIEECITDYMVSKLGDEVNAYITHIEDISKLIVEVQNFAVMQPNEAWQFGQTVFTKIAEYVELAYNELFKNVRLSAKEQEILQPLLNNSFLIQYSKNGGIQNKSMFVLPDDMFNNYMPDFTVMFGNSLESKFKNPSSLSELINYLGRNNYIDDDLTVKENLAYHITGVNRPNKQLETIVWHGDTKNLFWLCKQMFGKYAPMKKVIDALDDPDFKKRSGEYAERPTEEFKKMFNSLFR